MGKICSENFHQIAAGLIKVNAEELKRLKVNEERSEEEQANKKRRMEENIEAGEVTYHTHEEITAFLAEYDKKGVKQNEAGEEQQQETAEQEAEKDYKEVQDLVKEVTKDNTHIKEGTHIADFLGHLVAASFASQKLLKKRPEGYDFLPQVEFPHDWHCEGGRRNYEGDGVPDFRPLRLALS